MTSRELVVFEKQPRMAPELHRQFQTDEDVVVRVFRTIQQLESSLEVIQQRQPQQTTVALLDFDAGPAECLRFLEQHLNQRPTVSTIVVGSSKTAELEWSVRELGATIFICDYHAGTDLAEICCRLQRAQ